MGTLVTGNAEPHLQHAEFPREQKYHEDSVSCGMSSDNGIYQGGLGNV